MPARNEQRARRLLGHLSPDVEESYGPGQKAGVAGPGILLHQDSIAASCLEYTGTPDRSLGIPALEHHDTIAASYMSTQGHQTGVVGMVWNLNVTQTTIPTQNCYMWYQYF